MKMKKQVLLAACVLGLSSTALHASSQSVTTSNGSGCSNSKDTGHTMSVGTEVNSDNQSATAFVKLEWTLGQSKIPTINCNKLFNIEVAKQRLELEKLQLELELMKAKIANAKNTNETINTVDDW
jgi:hypothetical protein